MRLIINPFFDLFGCSRETESAVEFDVGIFFPESGVGFRHWVFVGGAEGIHFFPLQVDAVKKGVDYCWFCVPPYREPDKNGFIIGNVYAKWFDCRAKRLVLVFLRAT